MEAGTKIVEEGEPGDAFFLIVHGRCAVITTGEDGVQSVVAELTSGKYFGEIALVQECVRTATISCIEKCVIMSITKQNFDLFFSEAPEAIAVFQAPWCRPDIPFRLLLHHPLGVGTFETFCQQEFSEENITFWKSCQEYRNL